MTRSIMIRQRILPHGRMPSLPQGQRLYAIGDIHGCLELLIRCYELIDKDSRSKGPAETTVVHLGDYVDRGPNSRGVIDYFLKNTLPDLKKIWLKGNHEDFLMKYCDGQDVADAWFHNGAAETLKSYGVRLEEKSGTPASDRDFYNQFRNALPPEHNQFFQALKTRFECGDYFFTHAGVHPFYPLADQRDQDLMWIRSRFLQSDKDFGKIIIHGHTDSAHYVTRYSRSNIAY